MHIVQLLPTVVFKNGGVSGITGWRPLLSVYRLFMSVPGGVIFFPNMVKGHISICACYWLGSTLPLGELFMIERWQQFVPRSCSGLDTKHSMTTSALYRHVEVKLRSKKSRTLAALLLQLLDTMEEVSMLIPISLP